MKLENVGGRRFTQRQSFRAAALSGTRRILSESASTAVLIMSDAVLQYYILILQY